MDEDKVIDKAFIALAEQLKLPLLQIAYLAESSQGNEPSTPIEIKGISYRALSLIDGYLQARTQAQTALNLTTIDSGSVFYDVVSDLKPFASSRGFDISINKNSKQLITAHVKSLRTMLLLTGIYMIESADREQSGSRKLVLGAHRVRGGVVVGVFSGGVTIGQQMINILKKLQGQAHQILPMVNSDGGMGLVIADELGKQMNTSLRAYKHNSLQGIGSILPISHQLDMGL